MSWTRSSRSLCFWVIRPSHVLPHKFPSILSWSDLVSVPIKDAYRTQLQVLCSGSLFQLRMDYGMLRKRLKIKCIMCSIYPNMKLNLENWNV